MRMLPFHQLPNQGIHVAMIEVLDNDRFGLTVAIDTETFWVGEPDEALYTRDTIEQVHADLSSIAVGHLFLHCPPQIGAIAGVPAPFSEYTLIGHNLAPEPHELH